MNKSLYMNTHGQTQDSLFSECSPLFFLLWEVLTEVVTLRECISGSSADIEVQLNFLP